MAPNEQEGSQYVIARSMGERLPDFLCRYVSIQGERFAWLEDIVLNSRLYVPAFERLNDPFDGMIPLTFDATEEEVRAYWERFVREESIPDVRQLRERIDALVAAAAAPAGQSEQTTKVTAYVRNCGVASFAESDTDLLMWSYYADGHRGVCLRFVSSLLFGPTWHECTPPIQVGYRDKYPTISFYRGDSQSRVLAMLATKAKCWEYEREWRIIRYSGEGHVTIIPTALNAIVLGCKVTDSDRVRISQMLVRRRTPLRLLQCTTGARAFDLRITECGAAT